ncbi:hypothetical protein MflW12_4760 [Mesoplasma florum]|uniref:Uncharacterized protein n=1 Tax=Mesoplasma florum TaxID=2151 RepID=A0AAD0HS48_MESFO|nr:hypothetical protein MflW12_4760 [Mesoplasma florum]
MLEKLIQVIAFCSFVISLTCLLSNFNRSFETTVKLFFLIFSYHTYMVSFSVKILFYIFFSWISIIFSEVINQIIRMRIMHFKFLFHNILLIWILYPILCFNQNMSS